MKELKRQKLISFANDPITMEAVYDELLNSFLKEKIQHDVHIAAAERIAVDLLRKTWREIERIGRGEKKEESKVKQVGL